MTVVLDGSGIVTTGVINSGTAVATTSGTAIDFTGIPAGVKRVTAMFNAVSGNGTSNKRVQIGSGSIQTTGYTCAYGYTTTAVSSQSGTAGFDIVQGGAAEGVSGHMVLTNVSGNIWVASGMLFAVGATTPGLYYSGGTVTLSGTLDRLRFTFVNGTDTFDAGSVNVFWE